MTREEAASIFMERMEFAEKEYSDVEQEYIQALKMAISALKEPERKHGHWIPGSVQSVECSACGRRLDKSVYGYTYAPCCGAIMDEEE